LNTKPEKLTWKDAARLLHQWHDCQDRQIGRTVFSFIESELRLKIPPLVRRTWPKDKIEDSIQSFLVKLIEKPLPKDIDNLSGYITRAFRNHCLDLYYSRRRRAEVLPDSMDDVGEPTDSYAASQIDHAILRERAQKLNDAIATLDMADRVVLKIEHAPEWMDRDEKDWLSAQSGVSTDEVFDVLKKCEDMYSLSRVFDPGDDNPDDPIERRKRMERFRRRRSRARKKLLRIIQEERK